MRVTSLCGSMRSLFLTAILAFFVGAVHAQNLPAQEQAFDIPAQDLSDALIAYSDQTGIQVVGSTPDFSGLQSPGVTGTFTPEEALRRLIAESGLQYKVIGDATVSITGVRSGGDAPKAAAVPATGIVGTAGSDSESTLPPTSATAAVETARRDGIEEIIVTGQKREERIQDVPIAISAFSMENLDNQKIEGGFDLLKAVPNVTFTKSNFTGYNFQIRGIGTQAISATTDPGVAVSFNNTTLIVNRLFEQEYLDIERVEVLRGPQGTLFGRNATAGVINVITAKPEMGVTTGEFKVEGGNYGSERFRGHVNWAFTDTVAARAAFATTKRDGYGRNLAAMDSEIQDFIEKYDRAPISDNIDNRDLWTGRFSLGWQPNDRFRTNLIYERFEEDDRRMRSTKQLCHHADGNVILYDELGAPHTVWQAIERAIDEAPPSAANNDEITLRTVYLGQLSQGCLAKSMFDKGDMLSSDPTAQGAYGTPNSNSIPFVRAGRATSFGLTGGGGVISTDAYPGCTFAGTTLVSRCQPDPMATAHGQSRDMRDIFSLLDPRYQALSELVELSWDYEVSDMLTLSSQSLYTQNDLFSTQDFLRFKTQPMFNESSQASRCTTNVVGQPGYCSLGDIRHRIGVTPGGVFNDPQLGRSDRLLMQDVSQQESRQFSQELRLVSSFDGPLNFSLGANYTRFENTADYFVFINTLPALALGGSVYVGTPTLRGGELGLWGSPGPGPDQGTMTIGCGTALADIWIDPISGNQVASCIHIQQGSLDEVRNNPQGHHFFLSRNPFELESAGLFGELYYEFTPTLKLTAGLRINWDRKSFTPTPSQTLLGDWRGRLSGGTLFDTPQSLAANANLTALCHPNYPFGNDQSGQRRRFTIPNANCALSGMAENGTGYPTLPDIVQEWRVPTGRIGIDWKLDTGFTDETLVYGFYTRGYKAGGANPPTQSAPSGILLEAAQGAAAPRVFDAEYVNAFELGTKNRLLGGAVTLNGTAFYYDYSDYQVSKIVDRTAVNENFDATVWGLELEAVFSPTPDTLFNANVGYLRTRIGDNEQSLDLMDRTQGGNHLFRTQMPNPAYDPNWVPTEANPSGLNTPDQEFIGFDQWVVVRPTLTQASSCIAPAQLVYQDVRSSIQGSGSMAPDELSKYCPAGRLVADSPYPTGYADYSPFTDAPNGSAGFLADIGGNELPSAPHFTVSLGAQQTIWLPIPDWSATTRIDWYWQDKSYNRVYNTEYDRLQDWTNTNLSFWVSNDRLGLTVEAYVKNIFNETPITGAFLNSDDTGLSTNVFTLDPRLVGLSIRKRF